MSDSVSRETGFGLGTAEVKRRHILPKALVVGLVAGLLASAFRVAIAIAERQRVVWQGAYPSWASLLIALAVGGLGGGASVWLVRRFAPEAAGSGIPHVRAVVLGEQELVWKRVLPVKFFAGFCSLGSGLVVGREGPTVQMGAATGGMVSEWFGVRPGSGERRALIGAGAGAGLAAAFNAPLAGMMFVLEELQRDFTPVAFVATFIASVTADVVGRVLTGEAPIFRFHSMSAPTVQSVPLALILGAICGLAGVGFNRALLASLDAFDRLRAWPPFVVGAAVGALVGLVGWWLPGVTGGGALHVERALAGEVAMNGIFGLILLRFVLTMASYGCGTAGGIFAPLLVLGALGGLAVGRIAHGMVPAWAAQPEVFAVIGMGALLTAIVRAPLTAIVLMVELTGEYEFMLPLLASCLVAYGVAELARDVPIYEALRARTADALRHADAVTE